MSALDSTIVKKKSLGPHNPLHVYEGDVDIASVAAAGTAPAEQDITITGIKTTDIIIAFYSIEAAALGLIVGNCRVKADDTLAVTFHNTDDAAVDLAATVTFRLIIAAG